MKNTRLLLLLLLISFSSKAQTYIIKRIDNQQTGINYGTTPSYGETIKYIGDIQSQMQSKYDSNYEKISNEINFIKQKINELPFDYNTKKKILTKFINVCLKNVDNSGIDLTSNTDTTKAINYMYSSVNGYIDEETIGLIGIRFTKENEYFKIIEIIYGGSAWKDSQLNVGDIILKVGEYSDNLIDVTGMSLEEVVALVRGKKGTKAVLIIKKTDGTVSEIAITRE
jgi:C-terminal processing protease CtpA/Prc